MRIQLLIICLFGFCISIAKQTNYQDSITSTNYKYSHYSDILSDYSGSSYIVSYDSTYPFSSNIEIDDYFIPPGTNNYFRVNNTREREILFKINIKNRDSLNNIKNLYLQHSTTKLGRT
jgi:hypothetical protein